MRNINVFKSIRLDESASNSADDGLAVYFDSYSSSSW